MVHCWAVKINHGTSPEHDRFVSFCFENKVVILVVVLNMLPVVKFELCPEAPLCMKLRVMIGRQVTRGVATACGVGQGGAFGADRTGFQPPLHCFISLNKFPVSVITQVLTSASHFSGGHKDQLLGILSCGHWV